jgi:N-acyl-D-amino-acid deacylase
MVLFDPATVADRATTEPHLTSVGNARVWVNGREVYRDGKATGVRSGTAIRRQGQRPEAPPAEPR